MARTPAARRRRRRRFTPRRWLPFVALSALVVGAAVIEPKAPTLTPAQIDPSLDLSRLPMVTDPDAISSAWYCAGGTAAGADGLAELTLVMANAAPEGATADVTIVDDAGEATTRQVQIPANGRARLVASEVVDADWVGAVVEVRGGRVAVDREVVGTAGFDSSPCSAQASQRWYVPSGSTVRGAQEYLSLFNPFADATSVDISFATNTGRRTPRAFRGLSIAGGSVRVVKVGDTVTDRTAVAATVRARTGLVVVDRIQTFDGQGDPLPGGLDGATPVVPEGLASTAAVPLRADRWIFPSARVSDGVRSQIAIYNPSAKPAEIDVAVGFADPKRNGTVEPLQITVPAREQALVELATIPGVLPDVDLWVDVRSLQGVPVVAERLAYFADPAPRTGLGISAGSPQAATGWLVTQGGPTRLRSATVQVANPGAADAHLTVEQLVGGDRVRVGRGRVTVPAGDRRSLALGDAGAAATIIVTSDRPVVVASSLSLDAGAGLSIQPAFAYPEAVVALPPFR